jgi:hypothetical protein
LIRIKNEGNFDDVPGFPQTLQIGRSFPTAPLWGLVEKRLSDTFADIWTEVLKKPDISLDAIVEAQIK